LTCAAARAWFGAVTVGLGVLGLNAVRDTLTVGAVGASVGAAVGVPITVFGNGAILLVAVGALVASRPSIRESFLDDVQMPTTLAFAPVVSPSPAYVTGTGGGIPSS
jgi:hypothetical protein